MPCTLISATLLSSLSSEETAEATSIQFNVHMCGPSREKMEALDYRHPQAQPKRKFTVTSWPTLPNQNRPLNTTAY